MNLIKHSDSREILELSKKYLLEYITRQTLLYSFKYLAYNFNIFEISF